jgi:hypothetical protein
MDRRDASYDPFRGTFDPQKMIGIIDGVEIKCHYEVCDLCGGRGSHVNPSIDAHGVSREEFDDDPDFEEGYWRGDYDVVCYECKGRNVVPTPDENDPNIEVYNEDVQSHYEYMAEIEAERRMGC